MNDMKHISEAISPEFRARLTAHTKQLDQREAAMRREHGYRDDQCAYCGSTGRPNSNPTGYCACLAGQEAHRADDRRAAAENRWLETGVPRRYRSARLNQVVPENAESVAKIRGWLFARPLITGESLILSGGIGIGKTYLACATLRAIHDETAALVTGNIGGALMFAPVLDIIQATYLSDGDKAKIARLKSAACLVIDDLGAERGSDWNVEQLFDLLNSRYNDTLPTIVTTNLDKQDVEKALGARFADRLLDGATFVTVGA